jgi:hypothetical protein
MTNEEIVQYAVASAKDAFEPGDYPNAWTAWDFMRDLLDPDCILDSDMPVWFEVGYNAAMRG